MRTENRRYFELYDKDGLQILGTNGIFRFDNRLGNGRAYWLLYKQLHRQFKAWQEDSNCIKPRAKYCKLVKGLRHPQVIWDTIILHDLF